MNSTERLVLFHAELNRWAHDDYARHLFEHDLAVSLLCRASDAHFTEAMQEAAESVRRFRERSQKPEAVS